MAVELLEDRKHRNRRVESDLTRMAALVLALPPLVLAVVVGVVTRNLLIALAVLVVLAAGLAFWAWTTLRTMGTSLANPPGAAEVSDEDQPRLHNVVEGLCVAHGLAKPALVGIDGPGRNIASVTVGWGPEATNALVISIPLLDELSRIQLEGIVAQQLSQFLDGSSALGTLVAELRSTTPFGALLRGRLDTAIDPDHQLNADLAAVRLTRYPPGLASALDALGAGSTSIPSVDVSAAHLWLADPLDPAGASIDSGSPSIEVRVATLGEL